MQPKLGILAGGGQLPRLLIDACRQTGRDYFVLAFEGQADPETVTPCPHAWVRLGAVGKAFRLLHEAGAGELVLAGYIRRPGLLDLRPDAKAMRFLARTGALNMGDDGLLRRIVDMLETEGFRIVGPHDIAPDLLAKSGAYGTLEPSDADRADIRLAVDAALAIGRADAGQAAVARNGTVIAREDRAGTDAMLSRIEPAAPETRTGVLAKVAKPGQEVRADLPTVGEKTLHAAARAGLAGVAVEAGRALVLDGKTLGALADSLGLFLIGIDAAAPDGSADGRP